MDAGTGAVAGLATDVLARRDATIGAVIGVGGQAETQLLAMTTVRGLQEVRVFARTAAKVAQFVERVQPTLGVPIRTVA